MSAEPDLFGELRPAPRIVRLDRHCDRDNPCCDNLATIHAGKGPHAAELMCAGCGQHRGWLPHTALNFIRETARLWGAGNVITLRDSTVTDGANTVETKQQRENSGILFKNDRKETDKHPDYTGSLKVGGVDFYLNAWIKQGHNAKFMSLSVKPKKSNNNKSTEDQNPAPRNDFHDDPVPF